MGGVSFLPVSRLGLVTRKATPPFLYFHTRCLYLTARWRQINRARSRTRACGEHPFHVVQRLWGFTTVRYRGLAKNLSRAFALFALSNLYLVRRQLLPPQPRYAL